MDIEVTIKKAVLIGLESALQTAKIGDTREEIIDQLQKSIAERKKELETKQ